MTTTVIVDVTDEVGQAIGRSVPIDIAYRISQESAYGADADGNRGELRKEVEILDRYIAPGHLVTLNSAQVEQLISDADRKVLKMLGAA